MYKCDCENCEYFEEHPFARETMDDWCNKHETFIKDVENCVDFEE